MFVKITNKSEPVDRRFFEKLGAGNKQDDDRTIGQFGSGSCYAPLVALRTNRRYVVCGYDNNGEYQLEYKVEHIDGFDEIFYEYSNGNEVISKPSSFTLQAGNLGWNDPWQIFREAMSNALDEFYRNGVPYSVGLVGKIDPPVPGEISVYITADRGMKRIVDNLDNYFLMNQAALDDRISTQLYNHTQKNADKYTKIYLKGVLVFDGEKTDNKRMARSLYRYNLPDLALNEERTVKDTYEIDTYVSYYLMKTSNAAVIKTIIDNMNGDWLETTIPEYRIRSYSIVAPELWVETWINKYGPRAVMIAENPPEKVMRSLRLANYKPVLVKNAGIYTLLDVSGVLTWSKALGESFDYDVVPTHELPLDQRNNFTQALEIMQHFEPACNNFEFNVFVPNENQQQVLGTAIISDQKVMISTKALELGLRGTLATLVHEVDHIISQSGDLTDAFRDAADNRLADLMIKHFKNTYEIEVDSDYIYLNQNMKGGVNYRIDKMGDYLFLEIANHVYRLHRLGGNLMMPVNGRIEYVDGKPAIPRPDFITFLPTVVAEEVM